MLVGLDAFRLGVWRQRSGRLSAMDLSAVSVRGNISVLLSSHEKKCTAVFSLFTTISYTFICYRHHHYLYIRFMSLITGVVLSSSGCTGIGIVTNRFGFEIQCFASSLALAFSVLVLNAGLAAGRSFNFSFWF